MNKELKIKIRNLITGIYLTGYDQGLHESESPMDIFYTDWEEKFIDIIKQTKKDSKKEFYNLLCNSEGSSLSAAQYRRWNMDEFTLEELANDSHAE